MYFRQDLQGVKEGGEANDEIDEELGIIPEQGWKRGGFEG